MSPFYALNSPVLALALNAKKHYLLFIKIKPIGNFRVDLIVDGSVVLELKGVERYDPIFEAQLLSYMKPGKYKLGLLINFNSRLLKDGIKRFIL